jgi:hypothetical protein
VHRFAASIIACAVATTAAQAQTASELRISGTVEKLDGNLVALSLSQGISFVVRLDSELRVNSVAKGSGSDLKAGSQVGIQAKSGQSGDLIATQIVLFAPGSNRPDAVPGPDSAQLIATIKKTDASPEGHVLTIADKDRDQKITIGPDTAIWIARAARITDIKVGAEVTMTGVKREDGSLQVLRATIGPPGAGNPPGARANCPDRGRKGKRVPTGTRINTLKSLLGNLDGFAAPHLRDTRSSLLVRRRSTDVVCECLKILHDGRKVASRAPLRPRRRMRSKRWLTFRCAKSISTFLRSFLDCSNSGVWGTLSSRARQQNQR